MAAQKNLGGCYERGQGVAQDYALAAELYGNAAAQGHTTAAVGRNHCLAAVATFTVATSTSFVPPP